MELTFSVAKSPEIVFDYLSDMQKFASVHPVISKIEKCRDGSFLVHETLKLGFRPCRFSYPVTVEHHVADLSVNYTAIMFKVIRVEMKFECLAQQPGTLIRETITFKSVLPVVFAMKRVFKEQHEQLFKNVAMAQEV